MLLHRLVFLAAAFVCATSAAAPPQTPRPAPSQLEPRGDPKSGKDVAQEPPFPPTGSAADVQQETERRRGAIRTLTEAKNGEAAQSQQARPGEADKEAGAALRPAPGVTRPGARPVALSAVADALVVLVFSAPPTQGTWPVVVHMAQLKAAGGGDPAQAAKQFASDTLNDLLDDIEKANIHEPVLFVSIPPVPAPASATHRLLSAARLASAAAVQPLKVRTAYTFVHERETEDKVDIVLSADHRRVYVGDEVVEIGGQKRTMYRSQRISRD